MIADFQNNTSDPAFNSTLEPTLRRALEGASFVTAYDRGRLGTLGVQPPEQLDEQRARAIAANQGLSVVVFGSVDPQGNGYRVSLKAIRAVTGDVITDEQGRASSKDQVLGLATRLTGRVLSALGDDTPESDQQFARNRISTTSLEVVSLYAAAVDASARNRFEEARQNALKAVEVDPKFGLGYMIAAVQSANLGRLDDRAKVPRSCASESGRNDRARTVFDPWLLVSRYK